MDDITEKLEEIQEFADEKDWASALQATSELRQLFEQAQEQGID